VTCTATDADGDVGVERFNVLVRGLAPVGGTVPATLSLSLGAPASFAGPVSNGSVTIGFAQDIGAADALRTGAYSKTLTFTLSTTEP